MRVYGFFVSRKGCFKVSGSAKGIYLGGFRVPFKGSCTGHYKKTISHEGSIKVSGLGCMV